MPTGTGAQNVMARNSSTAGPRRPAGCGRPPWPRSGPLRWSRFPPGPGSRRQRPHRPGRPRAAPPCCARFPRLPGRRRRRRYRGRRSFPRTRPSTPPSRGGGAAARPRAARRRRPMWPRHSPGCDLAYAAGSARGGGRRRRGLWRRSRQQREPAGEGGRSCRRRGRCRTRAPRARWFLRRSPPISRRIGQSIAAPRPPTRRGRPAKRRHLRLGPASGRGEPGTGR